MSGAIQTRNAAAGRAAGFPLTSQALASHARIWWREVDRVLVLMVLLLMAFGALGVSAGSPASAARLSTAEEQLPPLYFLVRHLAWVTLGIMAMIGISTLPRGVVRRGGILLGAAMIGALLLVPLIGTEVNGARRWLDLGIRFQPSEFLKPAFAILLGWIVSWRLRDRALPVVALSIVLTGLIALLLMLQPNLGGAILFCGAWLVVAMLAGIPMQRVAMAGAAGAVLLTATYFLYDNARHRIDEFLGGSEAYGQVDLAARTLQGGGWTGTGIRLGTEKMRLPEAHTDYVFSVIGEEFGLLTCALIVLLYLAIVLRALTRLMREEDLFATLAGAGLVALFGGQAFINIMVNLQLFPSKGMTLPLVSYGGSSTIAQCVTIGALLALTRRNPFLQRSGFDWRALLPERVRP